MADIRIVFGVNTSYWGLACVVNKIQGRPQGVGTLNFTCYIGYDYFFFFFFFFFL